MQKRQPKPVSATTQPKRVSDVLADKAFMQRVMASAEESAKGTKGTRFQDLKRKNARH